MGQHAGTSRQDGGTEIHARSAPDDNVDPAEVARFGALAEAWWDPDGAFRPLHQIGPARLGFVRDVLCRGLARDARQIRPFEGLEILDVGCGGGLVSEPVARLGATVTGIDLASDGIRAAQTHALASGLVIDYRAESLEAVARRGEVFDAVLCLEVLEHIPDPAGLIATAASVLRPGGVLVLSTINRTTRSYALAIVAAEYVLRWLPRGTHTWDRFITPEELQSHVEACGLEPGQVDGLVYDPLRDHWSRATDTSVNYILAAQKPK
ncbi:MAG: bifunctional 2-polyprenyl-6-hydroxyphenol methylase/3-demethylubiquinol 3-O-methyltransferase UbiG [Hyphomicrobiaceae bacterium]|nr:bifunctional 2-polyprenyl-6-hydroxyphenol methylase/3-demethylubiquinol 3-O-methyltransferase UbiG [Hyphomicrobiaceae bacterium]